MIEVDEQRFAGSLDVSNSSFRRHLHEGRVAAVAEQVTASLATDHEEIQPAVVVVVREGGVGGALRKGDVRGRGGVLNESALHSIELRRGFPFYPRPSRHEKIIGSVAVDVAGGKRCRSTQALSHRDRSGARLCACEADVIRGVREFCQIDLHLLAYSVEGDEVARRKRKDGTPSDRTFSFSPFHIVQRRLIRRRHLHQTEQPVERRPRLRELSRAQELNRAVEIRPCFLWRLGRYSPHFLEMTNGAVGFAALRERVHELQSRDEIRRRNREHVS